MYVNLSGLNILVTGGSRGIGQAIATKLGESGATVAVHYHRGAKEAGQLAAKIGKGSFAIQSDLTDTRQAEILFDQVVAELGSIDILINNAAIAIRSPVGSKVDNWYEDWAKTMDANLNSPAILCKKAIDYFLKREKGGRIINISSRAAFRGDTEEYMAYASSKAGMIALTASIARAFGKKGITAFSIAPGFVKTDMAQDFIDLYGEEHAKGDISLKNLTEPKDIAPLVVFISSGLADHATGSTFHVNAGSYIH
jgi:NAD(P)-dependent dehydrogenase (short-subunit alcohol dehydrogenase family)